MLGEKYIENDLNQSIKLILKEDVVTKIDKYGTQTTTTYSNGSRYTGNSFVTNIYYGKNYYLTIHSDIAIKEGWSIKTLYLEMDGKQHLLCYKIIETNYFCRYIDNLSDFLVKEYNLTDERKTSGTVLNIVLLIIALVLLFKLQIKWFFIMLVILFFSFAITMSCFNGCSPEYNNIIAYIEKAISEFERKGLQLTKAAKSIP